MRGFTLIEALLVVAIMAVLALAAPALLASRGVRDVLNAEVQKAADTLYEARNSAMTGRGNARQGVHFTSTTFTLFQGSSFNPADPDNVVRTMPGSVTASTISISGGGADIIFASSKGIPVQTGSIIFTDNGNNSRTVSVNAVGMISVQ